MSLFEYSKVGISGDAEQIQTEDISDLSAILDSANRAAGKGTYNYAFVDFMRNHDKFGTTNLPGNQMKSGFTFITKPSLCLATEVISKEEVFYPLVTDDVNSMMYAIRCHLDPTFHSHELWQGIRTPLVSPKNPFNTMWGSGLIGFSGATDMNLDSETVGPGYMGEDQTRYKGYDYMNKTHSLTLNFRDIQGGPIFNSLFYMMLNMAYATDGLLPIYRTDADQFRLFYTFSIYRFITDATFRNIEHYAKFTGCYPDASSIGELFNFSETERIITAGGEFSIPVKCNHIAYNEPFVIRAFNQLVRRYYNTGGTKVADAATVPMDAANNYNGIPYVELDSDNRLQMTFKEE